MLVEALRLDDLALEEFADVLRRVAVQALGKIGPEARSAIPALNTLLDRDGDLCWEITFALDKIGAPPVTELVDFILRGDDWAAPGPLARLGPKAKTAVPKLRAALAVPRPAVRVEAAFVLALIDPPAPEAIPVLVDAIQHKTKDTFDAAYALRALARLGPHATAAIPTLIELFDKGTTDPDIVRSLVQIDPAGDRCVSALIRALKSTDDEVADAAAESLGLLKDRAKAAVPALTEKFTRDSQVSAARALGRIGPSAHTAIPALIDALKRRSETRRKEGGEEIVDVDYSMAEVAAEVLGSFGAAARAAVPALIEAVQTREKDDDNWFVREQAALALGRIGADAKSAIPALRQIIEKKPPEPLDAAVIALISLAPDGKAVAEVWVKAIERPRQRAVVLGALGKTSLEGDSECRGLLGGLDMNLAICEREGDDPELVEGWLARDRKTWPWGQARDSATERAPPTPQSLDSPVRRRDPE